MLVVQCGLLLCATTKSASGNQKLVHLAEYEVETAAPTPWRAAWDKTAGEVKDSTKSDALRLVDYTLVDAIITRMEGSGTAIYEGVC